MVPRRSRRRCWPPAGMSASRSPATRPRTAPTCWTSASTTSAVMASRTCKRSSAGSQRAGRCEPADDLLHVLDAITADVVDADVQQVGAVLGLVAGDLDALIPAGGQHRLLERLGTIGVRALAYRQE